VEIAPYQEADEPGVIALWREVFPDEPGHNEPVAVIRRKLAVQRELFLVARDGGAVVGTAMAGYDGHRGWIYTVAVHPSHRRRGVGAALLRRSEEALLALGCPKVNLQVRATNAGVVAFYRKLGYAVEDRVSMGKRLRADP
jgi:ribosomal protein S18 acetylase RimI-like enzyme